MSSLRNAVKRVTHKERSQPTKRAHLGILEKKKDYKVRSKDYHKKQDVLTSLRKKAAMRNPDEFYFGMQNSEVNNGRHRKLQAAIQKEREDLIGPEAVKMMKSQDLSYVRMQTLKDMKKVEKMQASLQFLGDNPNASTVDTSAHTGSKGGKHTIFLGSRKKALNFDIAEHFDTAPEFTGRTFNRPRKETLLKMSGQASNEEYDDDNDEEDHFQNKAQLPSEEERLIQEKLTKKQVKKIAKARAAGYKEMDARVERIKILKHTEAHLVTEKIIASKGRKRKIKDAQDGKPAVYKFRKKRAR